MTRIVFYSNLQDKRGLLISLVQQALEKKHAVTVMAHNEQSALEWSRALWVGNATAFLPNVLATEALAAETPVLVDWQEKQLYQDDILINLSQKQLVSFSRFRELIELVGNDEEDKVAARQRYKFYRDRGYEIKHIDNTHAVN